MKVPDNIICIIPARGGSKGIPRKNVCKVAGMPLVAYSIEHAMASKYVQRVFVSTEDEEIAETAKLYGAEIIHRPPELASDSATSESALLHALDWYRFCIGKDPDLIVFLQATSPIRRPEDIDKAIENLVSSGADSLLSVSEFHGFLWSRGVDGNWQTDNYSPQKRPMRQDLPLQYKENGSLYIFKPWVLRSLNCRLGGKIELYPMDALCSLDIDRPEDLELCQLLLERKRDQWCAESREDNISASQIKQWWETVERSSIYHKGALDGEIGEEFKEKLLHQANCWIPEVFGRYPFIHTAFEWGCGAGQLAYLVSDRVKKLYLLDISKRSLEEADEFLKGKGRQGYELIELKGDVADFRFNRPVDLVYSAAVIQHFPDWDYFSRFVDKLAEINPRVLMLQYRKGRETKALKGVYDYKTVYYRLRIAPSDFNERMAAAGFQLISEHTIQEHDYVFAILENKRK